ncbi:MAG: hypothetical protein KDF58_14405 [Alphaproteobacteria bacterium]|nr:hypothetical protein [Alphaproteobacteria bacterium]
MEKTKLDRLCKLALVKEGCYTLPDSYPKSLIRGVQYAINFNYLHHQMRFSDSRSVEIVAPQKEAARPFEFKLYRKELYQHLLVLDHIHDLLESKETSIHIKPHKEDIELAPNFYPQAVRIAGVVPGYSFKFEEHPKVGLIMRNKGGDRPLTERVIDAMKEAAENGSSVMADASLKIMTIKAYVSSYRNSYPGIYPYVEGNDVVFKKREDESGDADAFFEMFEEIFLNAPNFQAMPVNTESIPVSNNYFRTRIKAMCPEGIDVIVTIQTGMKRALVTKLPFQWECILEAHSSRGVIDPEWDDDEAYGDDDGEVTGFEIEPENTEML